MGVASPRNGIKTKNLFTLGTSLVTLLGLRSEVIGGVAPQRLERMRGQFQGGEHEPSAIGDPEVYLKTRGNLCTNFCIR